MNHEKSEEEIRAIILSKLKNRGCWGGRYIPLDSLVRWLSKRIKDGKRVRKAVRQLINDGYLIPHKRGETVSLNPSKSKEILEIIRKYIP